MSEHGVEVGDDVVEDGQGELRFAALDGVAGVFESAVQGVDVVWSKG